MPPYAKRVDNNSLLSQRFIMKALEQLPRARRSGSTRDHEGYQARHALPDSVILLELLQRARRPIRNKGRLGVNSRNPENAQLTGIHPLQCQLIFGLDMATYCDEAP